MPDPELGGEQGYTQIFWHAYTHLFKNILIIILIIIPHKVRIDHT